MGRLYRLETLSQVTERHIFDPARMDWYEAFEPLRAVAVECFPPSLRRSLPAIPQLRGVLVEAGEQQATYELARRIAALRPIIARRKVRIGTAAREKPSSWTDSTSAPVAVRLDWSGEGSRLHLEVGTARRA